MQSLVWPSGKVGGWQPFHPGFESQHSPREFCQAIWILRCHKCTLLLDHYYLLLKFWLVLITKSFTTHYYICNFSLLLSYQCLSLPMFLLVTLLVTTHGHYFTLKLSFYLLLCQYTACYYITIHYNAMSTVVTAITTYYYCYYPLLYVTNLRCCKGYKTMPEASSWTVEEKNENVCLIHNCTRETHWKETPPVTQKRWQYLQNSIENIPKHCETIETFFENISRIVSNAFKNSARQLKHFFESLLCNNILKFID